MLGTMVSDVVLGVGDSVNGDEVGRLMREMTGDGDLGTLSVLGDIM